MANKLVGFRVDEKKYHQLKLNALENHLTLQEVLGRAIDMYLATQKKKPKKTTTKARDPEET